MFSVQNTVIQNTLQWAARYYTGLLIKSTPKGIDFSFFSFLQFASVGYEEQSMIDTSLLYLMFIEPQWTQSLSNSSEG